MNLEIVDLHGASRLQSVELMPRVYKLQKLDPNGQMWRYYPHKEDSAYCVGEDERSARMNVARGSLPRNKALSMSPWLDPGQTSCVLDYDSVLEGVGGVEV